jgi:23S rRNA (cytosine1962-C5)-methyltransferase
MPSQRPGTNSAPASAPVAGTPEYRYPYPWVRLRSATWHAYLFQRMIGEIDPAARPGDVVVVYDKSGRLFGHAFYHHRSQMALRMLSYDAAPVDEQFFRARLESALSWRKQLVSEPPGTDAYRIVHAEGDGLSGLIAERYADFIAIEVFSLGVYRRLDLFKRLFTELTGIDKFSVRADERIERIEGFQVRPSDSSELPDTITIRESGLRFRVDLRSGHKTGFFCDQRDNRRRLAAVARGASMLDVCCYTGGFGVYAKALGGAEEVIGVDLDEAAIDLAKKNTNLNQLRIQHVHADAFAYLRQMQTNGRKFDIVVLDPPKFIANREEQDEGSRKYLDLNTLGMSVLRPGGLLTTCSCSGMVSHDDFLAIVKSAANRLRRPLQIVDVTGAAPDHPVMANCPESAYLKCVWARIM